jgi:L-malate glycosyltransferase
MRIAFVSSMAGGPWGGSEELWAAAARAALDAGHSVHISVYDWSPPAAAVTALAQRGAEVSPRPQRPGRLSLLAGGLAVAMSRGRAGWPQWLASLQRFAPDVVVVSQGSAYECVVKKGTRQLLGWLQRSGVPVVNLVHLARGDTKRDKPVRRRASGLYSLAAANLFVCRQHVAEVSAWLGSEVPRATVVRNPVNLKETAALAWPAGDAAGPTRLACVGRLDARIKGQDVLIRALARVVQGDGGRNGAGGQDLVLSLAGSGPDEGALRALAGELGVAERVTFLGQVSDLRALWSQHHLLVLASHLEGMPLAMVEATLLGRPALVTDVGGCADWVTDGQHGWIVPEPTEEAVTGALRRAMAVRERWREMGVAARQRALELFDGDAGGTLLRVATEVAGRGGGGAR